MRRRKKAQRDDVDDDIRISSIGCIGKCFKVDGCGGACRRADREHPRALEIDGITERKEILIEICTGGGINQEIQKDVRVEQERLNEDRVAVGGCIR